MVQQGAPAPTHHDPGSMISAAALRRDLFIFADDSMRGRETGTADARRAATFLARRVQHLGLEPAGDSLYLQRVPLIRETFARTTQMTVTSATGQKQNLRLGVDLTPVASLGSDGPPVSRTAEGDIIFVGNGPKSNNEALALLPLNLDGKVLVTVVHVPPGAPIAERRAMDTLMVSRLARLLSFRPSALVLLMSGAMEDEYQRQLPGMLRNIELDGPEPADSGKHFPMLLIGSAKRGSPLLPANWPNDVSPQKLNRQFSGRFDLDRTRLTGYNVVAVVRGLDPKLNKTYLAYGAHYDHIGILPLAARGHQRADSIANGADDDGSGSVALLAIAQQMMIYRPRRSVLFVWHVGEEKGLLGSKFFTSHPSVPIDSIVAQFNADMIGRNESNTVGLVGPRAAPNYLSWRLGMIVDSVNRTLETPFRIERKWDDPDDPEHIYQRSDHYNYAKKGIPIIFFTAGEHEDYHRVTDEASKIDYDKLARVTQLMLESGLVVSNRSVRPTSEAITQSISSPQP